MTSFLQPGRRLRSWALECLEDRCNPANAGTLDPAFGVSGIASAPFPNYTGFTPISTIFAEQYSAILSSFSRWSKVTRRRGWP